MAAQSSNSVNDTTEKLQCEQSLLPQDCKSLFQQYMHRQMYDQLIVATEIFATKSKTVEQQS